MKKKRVVVFGAFDILHPGHLSFLAAAKRQGNELVAVVTRDARLKAEKGRAPVFNEKERLLMVQNLAAVDKAVLGDAPGRWNILEKLKPSIVAVGHDQKIPEQAAAWKTVHLSARKRSRYSSTRIKEALRKPS